MGISGGSATQLSDHHVYTAREVAELEQAASSCGADALLCTEKDVWNLRHVQFTAHAGVLLPDFVCNCRRHFVSAVTDAIRRGKAGAAR